MGDFPIDPRDHPSRLSEASFQAKFGLRAKPPQSSEWFCCFGLTLSTLLQRLWRFDERLRCRQRFA